MVTACTGIAAEWCEIHGTCTCERPRGLSAVELAERGYTGLDRADCPLHGEDSHHPLRQPEDEEA